MTRAAPLMLHPGAVPGTFEAELPLGAAGRWCRLAVSLPGHGAWWVKLEVTDRARGQVAREAFLSRLRRRRGGKILWRETLLHLPGASDSLTLRVFAETSAAISTPLAELGVLSRPAAAWALLLHGWRLLPRALSGDKRGATGRVRAVLGQAPARGGEAPGYDVWIRLYDRWGAAERDALARATPGHARIAVVVVGTDGAGRQATLQALSTQWHAAERIDVLAHPGQFRAAGGDWLVVLQAGEVLADHALACFALAVARHPGMSGCFADVDRLDGGTRADPRFKPSADPWLLRTGFLTCGAWLFRADAISALPGATDADSWREALARGMVADTLRAIPFILTHVPALAPATRPAAWQPAAPEPFVSIVIPTQARSRHMLDCLRHVIMNTSYNGQLEILLAVSRVCAKDRRQAATLARAARLPNVRILDLDLQDFNYARVNNLAVRQARGELVLLLNDDVAPIDPDWLQRMVAFFAGSHCDAADIVGARLLYGNGSVQHGGVIMGLANLCEHAFRLSARHDFGPHGVAGLDRRVAAVTAACLLLRRSYFEALGGLDEAFAIALNDVDLCLRAGAADGRIVFAASVELHHYESLSLGRHYAGKRARLEAIEVRRLRDRWPDMIRADPFYNLSASLEPGREFQPAFPPRVAPLDWITGDAPAPGLRL